MLIQGAAGRIGRDREDSHARDEERIAEDELRDWRRR
jgi:hypothetical protein